MVSFGLKRVHPTQDLAAGAVAFLQQQETRHWQAGACYGVHFHALWFYIFIISCYIINSD